MFKVSVANMSGTDAVPEDRGGEGRGGSATGKNRLHGNPLQ